jgi:A/G-specific adenine glycosylase
MAPEVDRIQFQKRVIRWYEKNGRHDFSWRKTREAYLVLVAEILLRKTGAWKAEEAYKDIITKFKTIRELSDADVTDLKELIKPLGLHNRAELLIDISKEVMNRFDGKIPSNYDELISIKGIGQYIANSILCFSYDFRVPIVDESVKRVMSRCAGYQSKKMAYADMELWSLVSSFLPTKKYFEFNYGLLDIGATFCRPTKPFCEACPLKYHCLFYNAVRPSTNPLSTVTL